MQSDFRCHFADRDIACRFGLPLYVGMIANRCRQSIFRLAFDITARASGFRARNYAIGDCPWASRSHIADDTDEHVASAENAIGRLAQLPHARRLSIYFAG